MKKIQHRDTNTSFFLNNGSHIVIKKHTHRHTHKNHSCVEKKKHKIEREGLRGNVYERRGKTIQER
jgi:hypothetical protein